MYGIYSLGSAGCCLNSAAHQRPITNFAHLLVAPELNSNFISFLTSIMVFSELANDILFLTKFTTNLHAVYSGGKGITGEGETCLSVPELS